MENVTDWTRIEIALMLSGAIIFGLLWIVPIHYALILLTSPDATIAELFGFIATVAGFTPATVGFTKWVWGNREGRKETEERLNEALTSLQSHLGKYDDELKKPKFFRSDFPRWIDFEAGYIERRRDLIEQIQKQLDRNTLVLLLGKSGAGKSTLAQSFGYWALEEDPNQTYRYVYYEDAINTRLGTNAQEIVDNLNERIAREMKEHGGMEGKCALLILDDAHLYTDAILRIGDRLRGISERARRYIRVLVVAREVFGGGTDRERYWSNVLYGHPTSESFFFVKLQPSDFREAAMSISDDFFKEQKPQITPQEDVFDELASYADESLKLLTYVLKQISKEAQEGLLTHDDVKWIDICGVLRREYWGDLWQRYVNEETVDSTEREQVFEDFRTTLLILAALTEMEISTPIEILPDISEVETRRVNTFLAFLENQREVLRQRDGCTLPHTSLARKLRECEARNRTASGFPKSSEPDSRFCYSSPEGKRWLSRICKGLLEHQVKSNRRTPLPQILEFYEEQEIDMSDLKRFLRSDGIEAFIQGMKESPHEIVQWAEDDSDFREDSSIHEAIIKSIRESKKPCKIIGSISFWDELRRNTGVQSAIRSRIDNIAQAIRSKSEPWNMFTRIGDFLELRTPEIRNAIRSRADHFGDAIRDFTAPWIMISFASHWKDVMENDTVRAAIESRINDIAAAIRESDEPWSIIFWIGTCEQLAKRTEIHEALAHVILEGKTLDKVIQHLGMWKHKDFVRNPRFQEAIARLILEEKDPWWRVSTISSWANLEKNPRVRDAIMERVDDILHAVLHGYVWIEFPTIIGLIGENRELRENERIRKAIGSRLEDIVRMMSETENLSSLLRQFRKWDVVRNDKSVQNVVRNRIDDIVDEIRSNKRGNTIITSLTYWKLLRENQRICKAVENAINDSNTPWYTILRIVQGDALAEDAKFFDIADSHISKITEGIEHNWIGVIALRGLLEESQYLREHPKIKEAVAKKGICHEFY